MTSLTEAEALQFEALQALLSTDPAEHQYALIRTELDGKPVAVVAGLMPIGDGTEDTLVLPMAILLNDDLFDRLAPPSPDIA